MPPLVLVTGFGPFEEVQCNPSREVAFALEADPPPGVEVRAIELPVSFADAPVALRVALEDLSRSPDALVGLGVQKKKTWFRLESRARGRYEGDRTDNSGGTASDVGEEIGPDFETALDLPGLARALRAAGAQDVRLSDDAGGYVCERTYHALLAAGQLTGSPAVFLHLPPIEAVDAELQAGYVRRMVASLVAQRVGG